MKIVTANICSRLVEVGVIFLIVFAPIYYGSVDLRMIAIIELTILFMLLVWGAEMGVRGDFVFRRTPLDIVILLFCAYSVVSTLFFSRYVYVSHTELRLVLCISALYFVVTNHIRSKEQLIRIFVIILLVGFIHAFSHLMQNAAGLLRASTGTMFNVGNHFAGYMVIIIPLAVFMSLAVRDIGKRVLLMFAGIVMAAAMAFSLVAGAMVAFVLSLAFGLLLFANAGGTRKQALILGCAVLCFLLVVLWFGHRPVLNELLTVTNLKTGSPAGRLSMWKSCLAMFAHNPIAGTGLGTFDYIYPKYRLPDMYGRAVYAHSDWLQLLTELGIIGLAVALFGGIFFFLFVLKKTPIRKDLRAGDWSRGLVVGGLSSVGAGAAHALVDFNLHIPAIAVLFTIIIALTVVAALRFKGDSTKKSSIRIRMPMPVRIAGPLCLLLIMGFSAALILRPSFADAHYQDGVQFEEALLWDEAAEKYQSAIGLSSGNSDYFYALGSIYAKRVTLTKEMGIYAEWYKLASDAYNHATDLCPTNGDYYLVLGNLHGTVGNAGDAEAAYVKAISLDPNNAFYHRTYGTFCLRRDNLQKAIAEYTKALEVYPNDFRYILDTGYLTLETENWKLKTGFRELASSICPQNTDAYMTLARFYTDKGWYDAAFAQYQWAIKLAPERTDLRVQLSNFLAAQGRADEAISLWRQFLESNRRNALAHAQLAGLYTRQKRMDDAIQQYLMAADVDTDDPRYRMNAADLYVRQGKAAEAVKLWQTVVRQNPHTAAAYFRLGGYHESQGDWIDALGFFQQAIRAEPGNVKYRLHLAQSYHKRELLYEAIQEWKRALKLQPENVSIHLQLARVYRQIERQDKAKEHYSQVLKLQPGNVEAGKAISGIEGPV